MSSPQKPNAPAASHMLWFFILPVALFLGWATFQLLTGLTQKKPEVTLAEKARSISKGRSDGDRWKSAYSFAEELLKKSKEGIYKNIPESDRKNIILALSDLMNQFKEDLRLKKYLILTLGRLNDLESLPLLKSYLKDADPDLKFYSAWGYLETLAAHKESISEADFVEIRSWLKSEDNAFQKIATTFLAQYDSKGFSNVLSLLKDKNQEVRWNAAVALSSVGKKEGVEILREIFVLKNLRDFGFRSAKDLEMLLRSARTAAVKLNDTETLKNIESLKKEMNVETPEGKAISSALQ
ncbi:MAG: HEAT repeat domain-containing protein [bacterium]